MVTGTIGFPRRERRTLRFGSPCVLHCTDQLLHLSTGISVTPRPCHCSVTASLLAAVTEY